MEICRCRLIFFFFFDTMSVAHLYLGSREKMTLTGLAMASVASNGFGASALMTTTSSCVAASAVSRRCRELLLLIDFESVPGESIASNQTRSSSSPSWMIVNRCNARIALPSEFTATASTSPSAEYSCAAPTTPFSHSTFLLYLHESNEKRIPD